MSWLVSRFKKYERYMSALAMIAGFTFDNYFFQRVDHFATQFVLFAYLTFATSAIVLLHFIEARPEPAALLRKLHPFLVMATQFAFGGLWSAFLIFYGRSAVLATSWPFLLILSAMLVGNEMFRDYRSRLAFTCTLLFFALFSYMIFVVPIVAGTMGRWVFLLSGVPAFLVFTLVLLALWFVGPERIRQGWRAIALGALGVYAAINLFYFTSILPPLPLALTQAGIFYSVEKDGDLYRAVWEQQDWYGSTGTRPILRVAPGETLSVYSAVFAPIQLRTEIVHIWRRYDDTARAWRDESVVKFPITGGREGGYRGYSVKSAPRAGQWRVDIETTEGRLIGRVVFAVAAGANSAARRAEVLH